LFIFLCFLIFFDLKDFYKYLQVSQDFTSPDLAVINAGHTHIPPKTEYPPAAHPDHHYFNFYRGRTIEEYQVIYISDGEGKLETRSGGKRKIHSGDILFLFPGEWHTYKPDEGTGWTENWVGFTGEVSMLANANHLVSRKNPVVAMGLDESILQLFHNIFEMVKTDFTGAEYVIAGSVSHLLGHILTHVKRQKFRVNSKADEIIIRSKALIEKSFTEHLSLEDLAGRLNISYVWFRTYFKKHTGFSPYEYLINIRVNHAKILLKNSPYTVKEIADRTGFNSQQQFTKTFRNRTGRTPSDYKKTRYSR
jgi:AraC-like DNA-binding protein